MRITARQLSEKYLVALRRCLAASPAAVPTTANSPGRFGRDAVDLGWEILDLARVHEDAFRALKGSESTASVKSARAFFRQAVQPIEQTHRLPHGAQSKVAPDAPPTTSGHKSAERFKQRLRRETQRRRAAEIALAECEKNSVRLLRQSHAIHDQMRGLARQVLTAQEDERKEISRELHDEIVQPLAGINVMLATLKEEEALKQRGLSEKIAATQRLIEQSVRIVHRFARALRPTLLDDLGLIPALRSFLKTMAKGRGLQIQFTAFGGVEALDNAKRTVLYRVAQEALTNVVRHARARKIRVSIVRIPDGVRLEVADDGCAFFPERHLSAKNPKRLGLLGMRERVEMVGGTFAIESAAGKGTSVRAEIPFSEKRRR